MQAAILGPGEGDERYQARGSVMYVKALARLDDGDLVPMTALRALDLKLGGTRDLDLLPEFTELQYLELWMIRGLSDLSPVGDVPSLDTLFLQSLKHVTELPPMGKLARLRRVHLEDMKGLTDLTPLLTAPALEELILTRMGHLQPAQIAPLAAHPTLRRAAIHLGSTKKDQAAATALPLPPADPAMGHPALRAL